MSTICYRIIEYRDGDGNWKQAGKIVDNFHGFDSWTNPQYSRRGFPDGHTVTNNEIESEDGKDYTWGKSYITLSELDNWIKEDGTKSLSYLFSEINRSQANRIEKKIDSILNILKYSEVKEVTTDEDEDDITGNFDYFSETVEETFRDYLSLNWEYSFAKKLVDSVVDSYMDDEDIRIVFYYV